MNQRTLGIIFSCSLFSCFLSPSVMAAQVSVKEPEVTDIEIVQALEMAFMKNFKYSGQYRKTINKGYGLGCKKTRDFYVHWQSAIKDITVSLSDAGVAEFNFELEGSKAYLSYTGKDSLCMFKGYFGDVLTKDIRGEFHIIPQGDGKPAVVDVRSLQLSNLEFKNWTLFDAFLVDLQGDAPQFMNNWAQNSLNGMIKWLLTGAFADRFDKFVSKKVNDALKKRYSGGEPQVRPAVAPNTLP